MNRKDVSGHKNKNISETHSDNHNNLKFISINLSTKWIWKKTELSPNMNFEDEIEFDVEINEHTNDQTKNNSGNANEN